MMSPYVPSSSSIRLSECPLFLVSPYGPLRRIEGRKHQGTREETRLVHVVLELEVRSPAIRAITRRAYVQGLYQLYSLLNYWPPPRPRLLSQTFQADRYETTMTGLNPHKQPLKRGGKQAYVMIISFGSSKWIPYCHLLVDSTKLSGEDDRDFNKTRTSCSCVGIYTVDACWLKYC